MAPKEPEALATPLPVVVETVAPAVSSHVMAGVMVMIASVPAPRAVNQNRCALPATTGKPCQSGEGESRVSVPVDVAAKFHRSERGPRSSTLESLAIDEPDPATVKLSVEFSSPVTAD